MLSCASTLATYSYVDGVMRNAEIEKVSKKIELYEMVGRMKCDGSWIHGESVAYIEN